MRPFKGFKGLARVSRIFGLAGLVLLSALPARAADTVTAIPETGFVRLNFSLDPAAHVAAMEKGEILILSFDRKVALTPQAIVSLSGGAFASGHADADGKTLRFALNQPIRLHQSTVGGHTVVDLAPLRFTGAMPDLTEPTKPAPKPVEMAKLPEVKLRVGSYANFTRLVFDWPRNVPYTVFPGAGKMTIRFQALARMDLSAVVRFSPPWVRNAAWHSEGGNTVVEFETDSDSGFHDFRDGTRIAIDILSPKADMTAYAPPGGEKPQATAIKAALTTKQVQAIAETASRLDGTAKAESQPPAKLEAKAEPAPKTEPDQAKTAIESDAPQAPKTQAAESHRTRNGLDLVLKGAGSRASAVFVRGLTAWVVLENAPAFDATSLVSQLGDFATGVEASSGPAISILRIGLKHPVKIAAETAGSDLKVLIGADNAPPPIAVSFARNQDDPKRESLTTLLPGSDRMLVLSDPDIGDSLSVIPGNTGRAMLQERDYAQFAALPTASGLVITPYTDDLAVKADGGRITITRPGGLSLTPPSMPAADMPAALAAEKNSASFLDFAAWGRLAGGSFLATERSLAKSVARLAPPRANKARLVLARFYLANHFAAEALGLIDLIQAYDPGLSGDVQLATMRAAADYMMGRYRDAHNDLAGPSFDSDRNAALWRGLIEARLENWKAAYTYLDQAQPVLKKYPLAWQTRARLDSAESALGLGRLELADAAVTRLPQTLSNKDALEAKLIRARMLAAENHYAAAAPKFAAVVNGGDERLAAEAIYYQTSSALAAHAITTKEGIDILERLRFRWRGDLLEMKNLRKLASLYFKQRQWQAGLSTLRVAVQNFAGQDQARTAQDDMRAAFVNLYLKGGADKLPPVESLSVFYDNIDLTPIGPDGDEMIRRMVDRLVAVDLLGPAAKLLAYQVDNRLDGIAKAQVATRLAAIYLMDHKPKSAVDVLHTTQISGLPDNEGHSRMILEARAFAALKQWDNALDLIAVDDQPDTNRLRADIYWESGNWAMAGQKLEDLLGTRWSDPLPLSAGERGEVLRIAVAYSLANDEPSLDRLRDRFGPKIGNTPDRNAFAVLSQPIDMHGLAFREAAAKIASVDTLETFMKDFNKRHEMVAIN
jgi:hypothetical protein